MNYVQTLIAVADDCPVTGSVIPTARGGRKTVAVLHYELLNARPCRLTQEDMLFTTWLLREFAADDRPGAQDELALRERFFAKPQPCLRTSPLPKKYGFGLLFDAVGLVSLCPLESAEYRSIVADPGPLTIIKALRSARR
jgi:hypothetical protein